MTDFTERTHPISTKGPTRFQVVPFVSEAKRRTMLRWPAGGGSSRWPKKGPAFVCKLKSKPSTSRAIQSAESGGFKAFTQEVRKFLEPSAEPVSEADGWVETVDWEYVRQEVYGKGTTVKQIGQEVA